MLDDATKEIDFLDALERGRYCKERKIKGAKCDVPIRLRDGRLLALECKVSNGPKNGWKRLNREVGGKSRVWRLAFGDEDQVRTAVVLAGVFDVSCLVRGQDVDKVTVFWEHDLEPLREFVEMSI
jgi:hypothetical protein